MNERTKQFANIWANRRAKDEKLGIVYTFSEPALERFSELIVRECLSKVNEAVYAREMSGRYYPDSDGKKILKHFGVEE